MAVARFLIRDEDEALRFLTFFKARWPELVSRGRVMQIVASEHKPSRSMEQNARMWSKWLLASVAEQVVIGGRRYDAECWNEQFKREFLPDICAKGIHKWRVLPNGDRELMMSTTDLDEDEMEVYLQQCCAHASSELGCHLPVNPRFGY